MKKGVIVGIVIGVVVLLIILLLVFTNNKGNNDNNIPNEESSSADNTAMVDCGKISNPSCFSNRMNECLPVTAQMTATDGTRIDLTILGVENETCHFQRKVDSVVDMNCYFPKGTMNWDTIDQTFGNDKGLQSVVDSACKSGW
jgi:hypothetical protein